MENKNIITLKRNFINKIDKNDAKYTNQVENHDLSDYILIDAIQRCKEWAGLSPMKLGPVTGADGATSKTFEEFYQCSKVYPCMDANGKPNAKYYEWRNYWYEQDLSTKTARELRHPQYNAHPNSPEEHYEHHDCLYAIYYDEKQKKYLTSSDYAFTRKVIYLKGYAKLVVETPEYKRLKDLVKSGAKIAILDFDVYNYYSDEVKTKAFNNYKKECKKNNVELKRTLDDYLNIKTLKDVFNCNFMLAGHGFVLKALLQGDLEVINGEVVDHLGVLDI